MKEERVVQQDEGPVIPGHCYHCGDACDQQPIQFDEKKFCCDGCKTVYSILKENDLCTYYDLDSNPGITLKSKNFEDKYAYLDSEEIMRIILDFLDGERAKATFFIPSIHCSSCIWLLENLYKLQTGVKTSRVNFSKKELQIDFNPALISLRQLVELLATLGYEPSISLEDQDKKVQKSENRGLFLRIGVAGFAFGNIMLLSFPEYFGFEGIQDGSIRWAISIINILLAIPVATYCSAYYYRSAWAGLRQGFINIDVPISLGILALFFRSLFEILSQTGPGYFDSLAGLLFFLLTGRWFQSYTYQGLSFERDYKSYFPLAVQRLQDGKIAPVTVRDLKKGDIIQLRNNEIIPADCRLLSKEAHIDYSFVTGESESQLRVQNDFIYAGGRQKGESIQLEVVKPVSQSYLTRLWNNEAFASDKDSRYQNLINTISKYFTIVVLTLALGGLAFWFTRDSGKAIQVFAAVLIVACPCALSMATPYTLGNTMRIFGRRGFYLKNAQVIEKLSLIQDIVFDKTGTITLSNESELRYEGDALRDEDAVALASLTANSIHPLSRRIAASFRDKYQPQPVESYEETVGKGLSGRVKGKEYRLGSATFTGVALPPGDGQSSMVFISIDGRPTGCFHIGNKYRDSLRNVVERLSSAYTLTLLTGDSGREEKNLRTIFPDGTAMKFDQKPEDKLLYIYNLQKEKQRRVLMVGDGLNDAGALSQSDAGISITEDISGFTPASDAILSAESFHQLPDFLSFTGLARKVIISSFIISFMYNIVGLSFALAGLLTPLVAAILMPLSSITVVAFATLSTNVLARQRKIL
ncbi:MAG: heavy metal translocating P-type ATPase metal-binding domain-containing protein [Cyclobacteriaceae bacterium]|nr:heavy metal translocating P-type ATPase metal-binding domain-containing protein [Cyclobacteriaceae bacterium]